MTDINELMDRDPLHVTRDNISALVAEIRKGRVQFNIHNAKIAKSAKVASKKPVLDLSQFGLKKKGE